MLYAVLLFLGLVLAIEALCLLFRFRFKWQSRRIQQRFLPVRIHHGYLGGFALPAVFVTPEPWRPWLLAAAGALIFSDLIHHGVLKLTTGRFD